MAAGLGSRFGGPKQLEPVGPAGETLIDIWNTGRRYTVEELASMIGLGALDFDWLASESLESMEGRSA